MTDIFTWQRKTWRKLTQNREFPGHALLLKGKKGIGKYEFACHLAKSLLCTAPAAEQEACGKCLSCGWFAQNSHPNFYPVLPEALTVDSTEPNSSDEKSASAATKKTASQSISIEQIRKLTDFVYLSSHQNGYKVVLIYPAETMNSAAANALLKKLEEPPESVLFILVTHQAQHLPPTIRSRCRQIAMPVPDVTTAVAWLEQHDVRDPQACLAAAGFSPLSALSLDKGENSGHYEQFIQQISQPSRLDPLSLAGTLQQARLPDIVNWLQKWCYDLVCYRATGKIRYFINQLPAIQALSAQMDLLECLAFTRRLSTRQQLSNHPLNPRLFLEELFIAYAAMLTRK